MIIATVITCPRRWNSYQLLRKNFEALRFGFPLRTFQTSERLDNPHANINLNARAALAYGRRFLSDDPASGLLYLEDDVVLHRDTDSMTTAAPLIADAQQRLPTEATRPDKSEIEQEISELEYRLTQLKQSIGG